MNTTQNINTIFYQHLGKLFYAIAAADKVVRKAEYESLRNVVKNQWLDLEDSEDEFGADAAYQIEIVFDWLDFKELDPQDCFNEFESYYTDHPLFLFLLLSYCSGNCHVLAWH